jgi:hypothetical protein
LKLNLNQIEPQLIIGMRGKVEFKPDRTPTDYWDEGKKTVEETTVLIDTICEAIRKRIGILNVK